MKTKRFLSAAICIAISFTFFACSSGGGDTEPNGNSINMEGAVKAQPVAASDNINEPKVLTSWKKGNVNWYVIDVGHINYSLLMESDHIRNQGVGSVTISMSETVEESMSKSRTATVSNSVTFFESSTVSKNIQEVYDMKVGGGINAGIFQAGASVQATITKDYGTSVTVENTQGRTTETSDGIVQGLTTSRTNALAFTIDRTDPIGFYRYAWYATSDVYFIVSTSSDNRELLSWNTVSAPRAIGTQGIEYSEDGIFDNSPESEIVFAEDFYTKLPLPQPKTCGSNSYYDSEAFCDTRDNKLYKFVGIGTQTWMAENLNYDASSSTCHHNSSAFCSTYGRMYDWATAKMACPSGWHLPSNDEWQILIDYAGGESTAGDKLKATSGWDSDGNGTDSYGFAALPGGDGSDGSFYSGAGLYGFWWSASAENGALNAYYLYMGYDIESVGTGNYNKSNLFSVRCVKN